MQKKIVVYGWENIVVGKKQAEGGRQDASLTLTEGIHTGSTMGVIPLTLGGTKSNQIMWSPFSNFHCLHVEVLPQPCF